MKIGICDTILALNPTAQVSCSDNDVNRIEWLFNTPVIAKNTILAKQTELQNAEDNRIEQEKANKQSALTKLSALGLTEAEIKAILG
jgi:hypothetical protein